MAPVLHGSQTEKNLLAAFAGECQARTRYHLFAKKARKEGYEYAAYIFEETARNELAHAERFFSFLEGYPVTIQATYPAGKVATTKENIQLSINGETEEANSLYPSFAETARNEGFTAIAATFENIAKIEKRHSARYAELYLLWPDWVFPNTTPENQWICTNCGYIAMGSQPPVTCPVCLEDRTFFMPYP